MLSYARIPSEVRDEKRPFLVELSELVESHVSNLPRSVILLVNRLLVPSRLSRPHYGHLPVSVELFVDSVQGFQVIRPLVHKLNVERKVVGESESPRPLVRACTRRLGGGEKCHRRELTVRLYDLLHLILGPVLVPLVNLLQERK